MDTTWDKLWSELYQVNNTNLNEIEDFIKDSPDESTSTIKRLADDTIVDSTGGVVTIRKRGRPKKVTDPDVPSNIDVSKYRLVDPIESVKEAEFSEPEPIIYGVNYPIEQLLNTNIIQQDGPNAFSCPYVYDIMLHSSELGPNIDNIIKGKIGTEFLNQEIQGKMLVGFDFDNTSPYHLANIVNDYVCVKVPVMAKFKIYRIGDIIEGNLKINNRELSIETTDLYCSIYPENGVVSLKNNKTCFIKNEKCYFENTIIKIKLVSILTTTKSFSFITHGVIYEKPADEHSVTESN